MVFQRRISIRNRKSCRLKHCHGLREWMLFKNVIVLQCHTIIITFYLQNFSSLTFRLKVHKNNHSWTKPCYQISYEVIVWHIAIKLYVFSFHLFFFAQQMSKIFRNLYRYPFLWHWAHSEDTLPPGKSHKLIYTMTSESTLLKSPMSFICYSHAFYWLTWSMISLMFTQINSKGGSLMTVSCPWVILLAKSVISHFLWLMFRSA